MASEEKGGKPAKPARSGQKQFAIDAVSDMNEGYNNTNYRCSMPSKFASGFLYEVSFEGEDGYWRQNFVFQKGADFRPYSNLKDLLADSSNGIVTPMSDPEYAKLIFIILITLVTLVAVIFLVIQQPDNKSLQILSGILGLLIGYLVGKRDQAH